jgi:NAD(P)-dependent dehydrogenase (short-subunit alcohol dehydrogenase family)
MALHCSGNYDHALRVAVRVADAGAIAMPFGADLARDPEACRALMDRVAGDFGRLDVVVFCAALDSQIAREDAQKNPARGAASGAASLLVRCAEAAAPHLRKSRPAGHFVVLAGAGEESRPGDPAAGPEVESLAAAVREIAADWKSRQSRTCINLVTPAPSAPADPHESPRPAPADAPPEAVAPDPARAHSVVERTARWVVDLTACRGVTGQSLRAASPLPPRAGTADEP